jgi:hypothetical protein
MGTRIYLNAFGSPSANAKIKPKAFLIIVGAFCEHVLECMERSNPPNRRIFKGEGKRARKAQNGRYC